MRNVINDYEWTVVIKRAARILSVYLECCIPATLLNYISLMYVVSAEISV